MSFIKKIFSYTPNKNIYKLPIIQANCLEMDNVESIKIIVHDLLRFLRSNPDVASIYGSNIIWEISIESKRNVFGKMHVIEFDDK